RTASWCGSRRATTPFPSTSPRPSTRQSASFSIDSWRKGARPRPRDLRSRPRPWEPSREERAMRKREAYLEHLANVPMFSACPKRELQLLARAAEEIRIEPGTEIIREGDRAHEFFVIVEGKAKVTRN